MRLFSITKAYRICTTIPVILSTLWFSTELSGGESKKWTPVKKAEIEKIPEPDREFRGVWIATAFNLDWPSKAGLPVAVQKAELREIFDRAKALNLNAVVLQVRNMCDALYDSPIEPWSYYLTGKIGKAPVPFYDPLEFAIEEAHARGLELHAWINPYRALTGYYGGDVPDDHISKSYPWLVHKNGAHYWLDPSSEFVQNRVLTVAFDIVNRYDVDGIHLDDYFYPYPGEGELTGNLDDSDNWNRFQIVEGESDKADWRRENVNQMIKRLYHDIKRHRPWVKVGISPFGIWKSGAPEEIKGLNSYSQIFTDSRKWLREGWLDYISPQLYWKNEGAQSFMTLYDWWQDENVHGRHLWPGIATSRIGKEGEGEADGRDAMELLKQITHTREDIQKAPASGQLHWHWEAFATNRGGISRMITKKRYASRALMPESPWLRGQGAEDEPGVEIPLPMAENITIVKNPEFEARQKAREAIEKFKKEASEKEPEQEVSKASAEAEAANAKKNLKEAGETKDQSVEPLEIFPDAIRWEVPKTTEVARWWVVQILRGSGKDAIWELHDICSAKNVGEVLSPIKDPEKVTQIAIRPVDRIGELGAIVSVKIAEDED